MRQIFMLRQKLAGRNRIPEALKLEDVAIGWCRAKSLLTVAANRESYKRELLKLYPDKKTMAISQGAGEMLRYLHDMQRGDIVAVPDVQEVYLARLESDEAFYVEGQQAQDYDDAFRRRVKWLLGGQPVPKKLLSDSLVKTLNTQHTILQLNTHDASVQELLQLENVDESAVDDLAPPTHEDVLRLVKVRLDQSRFRRTQLERYGSKCCITGCETPPALEAAHILPYTNGNPDRNHYGNGLLLRADIHKLFDEYLISIDPQDNSVQVSRSLWQSEYRLFHGKKLSLNASFEKLQTRHQHFQSLEQKRPQLVS